MALAILLTLASVSNRAFAADNVATDKTAAANTERMEQIRSRLEEIKHMDRSSLTREERKELRREVKGYRKEAKSMGGGIYLSAGAIIIIILVLILIL
jgi:hypothetical protein